MLTSQAQAIRQQIAALVDQYAAIALAPQPFTPGTTPVPPSGKVIGAEELKNMVEASLDGWLTTGRFNIEFEKNSPPSSASSTSSPSTPARPPTW